MSDRVVDAAKGGQAAKIDGEEFVEPEAFLAGSYEDVGEINQRGEGNPENRDWAEMMRVER